MEYLTLLLFVSLITGWIYFTIKRQKDSEKRFNESINIHNEKINELKIIYIESLKSNKKEQALLAGRNYYKELRNGNITEKDEIAMNNDISLMEK